MRVLLEKVKEVLYAVLPITIIVLLLHFTLAPIPVTMLYRFLIGAVFVVIGLSIFLFGIDIGISPLGNHMGATLSKSNQIWFLVASGLILGFFITIAEPDLQILASKVGAVTNGQIGEQALLLLVSFGVGAMLVAGLIRIVYNVPLYLVLTILYGIILCLGFFAPPAFLAIAFDACGSTTGALSVPFVLAMALGVSAMKKDGKASEKDSFGLLAVSSTGAVIVVLIMGLFAGDTRITGVLAMSTANEGGVFSPFAHGLAQSFLESLIALLPIAIICVVSHFAVRRFPGKQFKKTSKGLLYTLIGLALFMTGVNAGFMDAATMIGRELARLDNHLLIIGIGFVVGLATILAEPAVQVLTDQIETVTSGYIKRELTLVALSVGVGLAVALSVVRILVPQLELWHYLLPGYLISIGLTFFVPKLYVGIAFDAGGVASGPMTATFILAFVQGIADYLPNADVLKDAFGMIALVSMTPIITLQILGLLVKIKGRKVKNNA